MKKMIFGVLSLLLLVGLGFRIWYVNKDIDLPPVHTFKMGEEIALGENIFLDDFENMDGYTVTVNNAEILSYEEFLLKYQFEEDEESPLFDKDSLTYPEMVYDLHLTVKNTNITDDTNPDSGINFIHYKIFGTDFLLHTNGILYSVSNPELELSLEEGFRLRSESEMDFQLPFYFSPSSKFAAVKEKDIKNEDVYLVISYYPNEYRILIE